MESITQEDKKFCKCGCGIEIKNGAYWIKCHNIKTLHRFGSNSSHWKGGKHKTNAGYIVEYSPNHKFKDKDGYVLQHRLVWEKYNNACLLPYTEIHHINHIRDDNRIDNLKPINRFQHRRIYHRLDMTKRICYICNSKTYLDYHGWEVWNRHPITKQEWLCRKCCRKIMWRLKGKS